MHPTQSADNLCWCFLLVSGAVPKNSETKIKEKVTITSPRGPVAGSKNGVPGSLKPNSVSANLYKTLIGRPVSHMWTWLQRCFGPQTPTHRVPGLKSWVMGSSKFRQFPRSHLVFYNEPENSETYFQTDILFTIRIFYWGQSCSA